MAELASGGFGGGAWPILPPPSRGRRLGLCGTKRLNAERPALPPYFRAETVGPRIHKLVGLAKRRRGRPAPACSLNRNAPRKVVVTAIK
jgi:hypothetical protein